MGFLFRKRKIEGKTAEEWFDLGYKEKDPKKHNRVLHKMLRIRPEECGCMEQQRTCPL